MVRIVSFGAVVLGAAIALLLASCTSDSTTTTPPTSTDSNAVAYSFVVLGCNRVDKADTNFTSNPSTANLSQFNRSMTEIASLNPKPDYLFFAGDMVLGYTKDSTQLASELGAWRALYEASAAKAAGIQLVAVLGNHESQNDKKIATAAAERQWLSIMSPYILGTNGPGIGGADSLQTDQSKLTYSFNFKDAHFVVVNTDPVGRDWRPASHWIASDIAAAKASGSKHIFAIGHKPAYAWDFQLGAGSENDGLGQYPENRDVLWSALDNNHAEAFLCAHNHVHTILRPTNKTWEIIAGNGGSKLETSVTTAEQNYGYTVVQVLKSGKVIEKSYGRNFSGYLDPSPASSYPTTVRDSQIISW